MSNVLAPSALVVRAATGSVLLPGHSVTVAVDLLPALLVVVPILLAVVPIVLGLRYQRTGWTVAAVTMTVLFAGSVVLADAVRTTDRVVHSLGGWPRAVGIELVADPFSTLIVLLVTGVATATLAYLRLGGPRGNTFYAGYLLLVGGLLGLSLTGDIFNMFVFLEIVGLATYALIATGDSPESAVAALKYLILGTIGASLYLIGVGFLFMATGTLNMQELSDVLPAAMETDPGLLQGAFVFVFVGFALKVAQWPLHTWQPDAYQHAPDGVTPVIAALVSTVYAYALGRIMFTVFGVDFLTGTPHLQAVVMAVGTGSVVAGSTLAVIQTDVKRMFAYSSVSQFGLVVAAYGLVSETALIGAIVHLIGHGVMKAGLFVGAGAIALGYGARTVDAYAGLASRRPVAAGGTAVLLISLIGVPPSAGFIGKWYIALGAVEAEAWPVAAIVFLSTMLTLAYATRLLEKMYFTPSASPVEPPHGPVATDGGASDVVSTGMRALLIGAAVGAVLLGFAGGAFVDWLAPFTSEVFVDG